MTRYLQIPFVDKGRTFQGADCYGLVKLYFKNELNINIPETNITAEQPNRIMINYLNEISKNWEEIQHPETNCVIALAMHENHPKLVTHFAVMINDKKVLHTLRKINAHIVDVDNIQIKPFIKGYFRWKGDKQWH